MYNLSKKIDLLYKLASEIDLNQLIIEGIQSDENWQVLVDFILENHIGELKNMMAYPTSDSSAIFTLHMLKFIRNKLKGLAVTMPVKDVKIGDYIYKPWIKGNDYNLKKSPFSKVIKINSTNELNYDFLLENGLESLNSHYDVANIIRL